MDWKEHGVKIVHAGELDMNTPQTSGMTRAAAITHARTGAEKLWAGTMVVQPDAKTGPHHHGELETVLYVVKGRVRMRWGDRLELSEEARAGDFIYVPPYVPHQEINGSTNEICEAVVVRAGKRRWSLILTWKRRNLQARGIQGCRSIPADTIAEVRPRISSMSVASLLVGSLDDGAANPPFMKDTQQELLDCAGRILRNQPGSRFFPGSIIAS
jgi:uncharacterized RmlC-like cupin family protein